MCGFQPVRGENLGEGWLGGFSLQSHRSGLLGLDVCSVTSKFYIPVLLERSFYAKRLSPRQLARLVGKLQSCSLAVGPVVRLVTRELYRFICKVAEDFSWSYFHAVPEEVKSEVLFWWQHLAGLNGFSFSLNRSEVVINFEVASDASGVGVYAYQFVSDFKLLLK